MRQVLTRCLAVALGLIAALALAEGVLRAVRLAPTNGVATVTEAEFRSLPGVLSPGQDLVDRRDPRLPHRVTTNDLGYRGPALPLDKAPGEFRILFTGDSFAYGDFVDDEQTLPAQLEQRLAGRCGHVRVVNAGLDAATILDEVRMIERGVTISPDLVILLFSENDVDDLNRVSIWDRSQKIAARNHGSRCRSCIRCCAAPRCGTSRCRFARGHKCGPSPCASIGVLPDATIQ